MLRKLFEKIPECEVFIDPSIEMIEPVDTVVDSRHQRVSRVVRKKFSDDFGDCNTFDFSISNLKDIGAFGQLQRIKMAMHDVAGFANMLDSVGAKMDAAQVQNPE